jgi:glycosyltransferase involved in cell wall biosynthesis
MVVGAQVEHPLFAALAERHPGQILCMGNVPSPDLHRAAADIYLDSYPFASITSMLESAARGTPVIAYQPDREELEILYSECAWLRASQYSARSAQELVDLLNTLVDDVQLRADLGARSLEGMAMHFPASWRLSMQSHLSRTFPRRRCLETQGQFDDELIDRVLAGLMSDIRDHSSLQHQMGLDAIGKSEVTFRRILGQL